MKSLTDLLVFFRIRLADFLCGDFVIEFRLFFLRSFIFLKRENVVAFLLVFLIFTTIVVEKSRRLFERIIS